MLAQAAILVFAGLMLLAAWADVKSYTIPNWIPGVMALAFIPGAWAMGLGWAEAGAFVLTGFAVLVVMIGLWLPGWIGGGDAKLIAAGALWFGWPDAAMFLLLSGVAGGALAVGLLMLRRFAPGLPGMKADWIANSPLREGAPAPYALAIAAGALWALPMSGMIDSLAA